MDTASDRLFRLGTFRLPLTLTLLLGLGACAVPLNKEDLAAYKEKQAERAAAQPAWKSPSRSNQARASSTASNSVSRAKIQPAPTPQPVEVAKITGVTREALAPVDGSGTTSSSGTWERKSISGQSGPGAIHVVEAGDTVYAISREYGIDPKALIAFNALVAPFELSIGQEIRIPQAVAKAEAPTARVSSAGSSSGGETHRVGRGETVYGIARLHGVPLRQMIDANGLAPPYTLSIGQQLILPRGRRHQVAKGETVYSIARRYEIDQSELVRLNRISAPFTIKPSQVLILPGPRKLTPAAPRVAAQESAVKPSARRSSSSGSNSAAGSGGSGLVKSARANLPPAAIPKPPPRAAKNFLWPVSGNVILGYGPKKDGRHNDGINIAAPRGTPIRAADNGVVAYAGNELRGFGNLVLVKHAGGWVTAYAHTDKITVRRGDTVRRGQTIGSVGSSGNVLEPQLHFEVRKGTRAVNPSKLLGPRTASN